LGLNRRDLNTVLTLHCHHGLEIFQADNLTVTSRQLEPHCGQSGRWSIGIVININVVNRHRGQLRSWSIETWSIAT